MAGFGRDPRSTDGEPGRVSHLLDGDDLAEFFHYPGEHPRFLSSEPFWPSGSGGARTRERGWQLAAAAARVLPPIRTLTVGPGIPPGQPAAGG